MKAKSTKRKLFEDVAGVLIGTGLAIGGLSVYDHYRYENQTLANKVLEDFPEEIPGAKEVKKLPPLKGSDKVLVHLRQLHLSDRIDPNEEDWKNIQEVQGDIYEILDYLVSNEGVNVVYSEGTTSETMHIKEFDKSTFELNQEYLEHYKTINERMKNINSRRLSKLEDELEDEKRLSVGGWMRYGEDPEATEKYREDLREEISKIKNQEYLSTSGLEYKIAEGALNRLFYEGKLNILPAETMEGNENGIEVLERGLSGKEVKWGEFYKYVSKDREDIALELISESNEPLNVMVYGGAHDWRDNILEWNKENPDEKYSLIEISPESYNGTMRFMGKNKNSILFRK